MMKDVKDIPAVKEMLAKAKDVLGYDLLETCLEVSPPSPQGKTHSHGNI
jgi:hypothetical protein